MKKSRFTDEQIIGVLQEHEHGAKIADLCRKHGITEVTFAGSGNSGHHNSGNSGHLENEALPGIEWVHSFWPVV